MSSRPSQTSLNLWISLYWKSPWNDVTLNWNWEISWVVPPPSISGKCRFIGIPYKKCNNPGGHYYWDPRKKCLSEFLGHHCNCTGASRFVSCLVPMLPGHCDWWGVEKDERCPMPIKEGLGWSWYMWYRNPSRNSHKTCLYLNSPKIFTKKNLTLKIESCESSPPHRGWAIRFDGAGRPPSVGRQQNWSAMVYPCAYDNG